MSETQLFLPFFEASRYDLDRLFFAILPSPVAAAQIAERIHSLCVEHGLKGRPVAPSRLHISLHGLGDHSRLPQTLIEVARNAAASIAMPPFEIEFDRVMSFNRKDKKRPFVLRVGSDMTALNMFHRCLGDAMKKAGLGLWVASHFTLHMTLLYDDCAVKERPIEPICLTVSDFVLVHSLVGRSRYLELARWPLRRGPGQAGAAPSTS
jgi:RNA 2',3'-cyclic 3'-phosphodiesterase